jgi:hypothetical protein
MDFYVDSDYRLHTSNPDGAFREAAMNEGDRYFFSDKCQTFIEGYCYDDSMGYVQVYPWKPYDELDAAQRQYEREQMADMKNALATLGVNVDG